VVFALVEAAVGFVLSASSPQLPSPESLPLPRPLSRWERGALLLENSKLVRPHPRPLSTPLRLAYLTCETCPGTSVMTDVPCPLWIGELCYWRNQSLFSPIPRFPLSLRERGLGGEGDPWKVHSGASSRDRGERSVMTSAKAEVSAIISTS